MKFVLHHIPKTGGHSIVQSFRAIFGPDAVDVDEGDAPLITTHGPSWEMFANYPDREHITILRDPGERIRSYVRYTRTIKGDAYGQQIGDYARDLSASEFLRLDIDHIRQFTHDRQVRQLGGFDYDESDAVMPRILDRALESLERMAWVGHTETLTDDLDGLFGKLNPRLPPQNKSTGSPVGIIDCFDALTSWDNQLIKAWRQ